MIDFWRHLLEFGIIPTVPYPHGGEEGVLPSASTSGERVEELEAWRQRELVVSRAWKISS